VQTFVSRVCVHSPCFRQDGVAVTIQKFSAVNFITQFASESLGVTVSLQLS
jgi:hypothetical protein